MGTLLMSIKELSRLEAIQRLSDKLNKCFAEEPRSSVDAHCSLTTKDDLARI